MVLTSPSLTSKQSPSDGGHPPCLSQLSPWLAPIAYGIGAKILLPTFFSDIRIVGQENLPQTGPVVFAPTHRSRWDALLVALIGHRYTGRYLRFMVTADECSGLQGWAIKRLGGFPVDVRRPAIATLRHGVKLLLQQRTLVIFPEGDIFRQKTVQPLKPGLARLALRAEESSPGLGVKVLPIYLDYSVPRPGFGSSVEIRIGRSLSAERYVPMGAGKQAADCLTQDLRQALAALA